jgi:hypothetical protein
MQEGSFPRIAQKLRTTKGYQLIFRHGLKLTTIQTASKYAKEHNNK